MPGGDYMIGFLFLFFLLPSLSPRRRRSVKDALIVMKKYFLNFSNFRFYLPYPLAGKQSTTCDDVGWRSPSVKGHNGYNNAFKVILVQSERVKRTGNVFIFFLDSNIPEEVHPSRGYFLFFFYFIR